MLSSAQAHLHCPTHLPCKNSLKQEASICKSLWNVLMATAFSWPSSLNCEIHTVCSLQQLLTQALDKNVNTKYVLMLPCYDMEHLSLQCTFALGQVTGISS